MNGISTIAEWATYKRKSRDECKLLSAGDKFHDQDDEEDDDPALIMTIHTVAVAITHKPSINSGNGNEQHKGGVESKISSVPKRDADHKNNISSQTSPTKRSRQAGSSMATPRYSPSGKWAGRWINNSGGGGGEDPDDYGNNNHKREHELDCDMSPTERNAQDRRRELRDERLRFLMRRLQDQQIITQADARDSTRMLYNNYVDDILCVTPIIRICRSAGATGGPNQRQVVNAALVNIYSTMVDDHHDVTMVELSDSDSESEGPPPLISVSESSSSSDWEDSEPEDSDGAVPYSDVNGRRVVSSQYDPVPVERNWHERYTYTEDYLSRVATMAGT